MGLDAFKKRAKNAIKAAALGGTLMAGAPAAAEAQQIPSIVSDFIRKNEGAINKLSGDAQRIVNESLQQAQQLEQTARIIANSPEAQKLIEDSRRFVAEGKARAEQIGQETRAAAQSPEADQLREVGKRMLREGRSALEDASVRVREIARDITSNPNEGRKRLADEFNRIDRGE